jgi:uncharacterized membrane protein YfcA
MFTLPVSFGIFIVFIAFLAEYIDSSVGMGYGTSLTPVLLLMGFEPLQVVPAVLLSELVSGLMAAVLHHTMGNADFRLPRVNIARLPNRIAQLGIAGTIQRGLTLHLRIVLVLVSCSLAGTVAAVFLALSIPQIYLKLYIIILIFVIGIVSLLTVNKSYPFSWKKIATLGLIAAFNKGLSGGGYGPVVTSGQLLSGVNGKNAVAITSFSEGLTCLVGVALYWFASTPIDWTLAPYLLIGAVLSVPLSTYTVKKINSRALRFTIGGFTVAVAGFSLLKLFV